MKTSLSPVFGKQMEQIRSIQGSIFNNDAMGELSPLTRLLFAGLWCLVDDKGRTEDKPRKLKKVIMGYDDASAGQVDEMLQSLHDRCFIVYTARMAAITSRLMISANTKIQSFLENRAKYHHRNWK